MKTITRTKQVPRERVDELNHMLSLPIIPDIGDHEIVETFTVDFGEGIEADIKVCNGDTPFVDPVIFENGSELCCIDVCDEIDGEYHFLVDDITYIAVIEACD